MAVLITGGAGFVGLNVAEALLARGEEVVVFGREAVPDAAARAFAALPGRVTAIRGDVLDPEALAGAFRAGPRVEAVLPFAAITAGPEREARDPEAVVSVNLLGLVATLRAARDAGGVRRVVLPSSGAVYGETWHARAALPEADAPALPTTVYGVTKYAAERAGLRLCAAWGLEAVAARVGAAWGPWERDTGARDTPSLPLRLARAALAGDGEAVLPPAPLPPYDWVYARDLAGGLLALLDRPGPPPHPVANLGSGEDGSAGMVPALCDALAAAFPGFRWRHAAPGEAPTVPAADERPRGVMDIARAREGWGWSPRLGAGGGAAAVADYLAWLRGVPGAPGLVSACGEGHQP